MKRSSLDLLACPACQNELAAEALDADPIESGNLACPPCRKVYPVVRGMPRFLEPRDLTGLNRRFAGMYDWSSGFYRAFSRLGFALIGMPEAEGRREITDRLEPDGGKVLEVSIGPGVNLPHLMGRPDVGEVYGLDISGGQLEQCRRYTRGRGWDVDLFLGNAEELPFRDSSFDSVFHVGGINFFNNKKAAIDEMIRVAKPGTRILIADETERGAKGYEKTIPGFKGSFEGKRSAIAPPLDLLPPGMQEVRLFEAWKGWFYCIEFRKP